MADNTAAIVTGVNSLATIALAGLDAWTKAKAAAAQAGITDEQLGEAHAQLQSHVDVEAIVNARTTTASASASPSPSA